MSKRLESRILAAFTVLLAAFSLLQLTAELKSVLMLYLPFAIFPALFLQGVIIHSYTRKLLGFSLCSSTALAFLFVPALTALAFQIAMFLLYPEFRDVTMVYAQQGYVRSYTAALFFFALSYNFIFLWQSARLLREKSKLQRANGSHRWLKIFLGFNAALCLAGFLNVVYNLLTDVPAPTNPFTAILLSGGNYLILTFLIREPSLFAVSGDHGTVNPGTKYAKMQNLDAATRRQYLGQIQHYLTTHEAYLDDAFDLKQLSQQVGIPPHLISMVINTELQQNFYTLVNTHRVNKAKELLLAEEQPNILQVAYASGFQSKSAFNKVFKQFTGQTPSDFKGS